MLIRINKFDVQMSFKQYQNSSVKPNVYTYHPGGIAPSISEGSTDATRVIGNFSLNVPDKLTRNLKKGSKTLKMRKDCVINILIFKKGQSMIGRKQGTYKCKELGCNFKLSYSTNPKALVGKQIVLLYLRSKWDWQELLKVRPPNQIWIFYCRESPLHDQGIVPPPWLLRTTYNWTMTYRSDSTINAAYGAYIPGEPEIAINDTRNWAAKKTKLVAWMASNCNMQGWPRTTFVKTFSQKYLKVDMLGSCGTLSCPKGERCQHILSRYKFYFALENSLCTEYITEKFWRNALLYGSVPIVFGAAREDYERLAPPNSFIHLSDFDSPEKLRDYLLKLDGNDTLYNQYFEWKKYGRLQMMPIGRLFLPKTFCEMAAKYLETQNKLEPTVTYKLPSLKMWWQRSCNKIDNVPVVDKVLKGK